MAKRRKRLLSEHFREDGKPKRALGLNEARDEAHKTSKHFYLCSFCMQYHLGGMKSGPKRWTSGSP